MYKTGSGHTRADRCPGCDRLKDSRAKRCFECYASVDSDTKTCRRCGEEKPKADFWRRSDRPDKGEQGRLPYCKTCSADWHRWHRLLKKYGVTREEYEALYAKQGGVCAVCACPPTASRDGVLHVDHCHTSGAVRGLLCFHCNAGIGHLKDNASLMAKALTYVSGTR